MSKSSEAAKRKACEVLAAHHGNALNALASVLQEYSDVAKEVRDFLALGRKTTIDAALNRLQSLIMPEDSCRHEVDCMRIDDLSGVVIGKDGIRCLKCGKRLKLTEAGDD